MVHWRLWLMAVAGAVGAARGSGAELTFVESFDDDPIAAGRFVVRGDADRFIALPGALTALVDTKEPTALLLHPLERVVTPAVELRLEVDLVILSDGFSTIANTFAQMAFGLVNSVTTGDDRVGGAAADGFDVMSIDYFPNVSPLFGGPTLGPIRIASERGQSLFEAIQNGFAFGPETDLTLEGPLPLDTPLTFVLHYVPSSDATMQTLTLEVHSPDGPLPINREGQHLSPGGPDGDETTIQAVMANAPFALDSVGILLWEDTFSGGRSTLTAAVRFDELRLRVHWPDRPGDADLDGDVDLADFLAFVACFHGAGVPIDAGCAWADFDADGDADLADLVTWQTFHGGSQ